MVKKTPRKKAPRKKTPRKKAASAIERTREKAEDALFTRVVEIIEAARKHVNRSVDVATVQASWLIGREIVEVEQGGEKRAEYGGRVIERLSRRLARRVGKGFSVPNLRNMRQFYLTYPEGSALPGAAVIDAGGPEKRSALPSVLGAAKIRSASPSKSRARTGKAALVTASSPMSPAFPTSLGWTHYQLLMRIANPTARAFYEVEAARESWSSRELGRQIASLLFERLAKSRNKEKVLELARLGQSVEAPSDVMKDPFVLRDNPAHRVARLRRMRCLRGAVSCASAEARGWQAVLDLPL